MVDESMILFDLVGMLICRIFLVRRYYSNARVVRMLLAVFCLVSRGSEPVGDRLSVTFFRFPEGI